MTFASVYPLLVAKVERKGRTKKELHEVIKWLTGYDEKKLKSLIADEVTFETFSRNASCIPMRTSLRESFVATELKILKTHSFKRPGI